MQIYSFCNAIVIRILGCLLGPRFGFCLLKVWPETTPCSARERARRYPEIWDQSGACWDCAVLRMLRESAVSQSVFGIGRVAARRLRRVQLQLLYWSLISDCIWLMWEETLACVWREVFTRKLHETGCKVHRPLADTVESKTSPRRGDQRGTRSTLRASQAGDYVSMEWNAKIPKIPPNPLILLRRLCVCEILFVRDTERNTRMLGK